MRIIAGAWRSRQLVAPAGLATRPMPDRVREAVFDILGSYYGSPGTLPSIRVADLFAGSGSMGLEALSRGACWCSFFERNTVALAALRKNVESLRAAVRAAVIPRDAWSHTVTAPDGYAFDLILLDPPYTDSNDASDGGLVRTYLAHLGRRGDVRPLVVLHHEARVCYPDHTDEDWHVRDRRIFGTNGITIFER